MASVYSEISALKKIGEHTLRGERCPFAFGYANLDDEPRDFLFEIEREGDRLVAVIDLYTARGIPPTGFDADAWEASKLFLEAPISKESFCELARAARAMLNGRRLNFAEVANA